MISSSFENRELLTGCSNPPVKIQISQAAMTTVSLDENIGNQMNTDILLDSTDAKAVELPRPGTIGEVTKKMDEESTKRGRRMMGLLQGTLKQFKRQVDVPAAQRQQEIQNRLLEKVAEERALIADQLDKEQEANRLLALEQEEKFREQCKYELQEMKRERKQIMARFLQTKGPVPLYYLPAVLTEEQEVELQAQQDQIFNEMEE